MPIRRLTDAGQRFFFTVVTHDRRPILTAEIDRLRDAFRRMQQRYPFEIEAMVVLPDHLHTMWALPESDPDYSRRWQLVKRLFSAGLASSTVSASMRRKREKGIWQRRFRDHAIRDDRDWRVHLDYIHFNPVKHGYCSDPAAWPYSSFHRLQRKGLYPSGWGKSEPDGIDGLVAFDP